MLVSSAFRYDGLASAIQASQSRMDEAQARVTSGKRITKPSDDATGTRQLLGIGALRSGIAGYDKNLDVAKSALTSTEAAYGDLGDLVQQAQTLAVQGGTSALDAAAQKSLVDQVSSLQDRLVGLGNSQGSDGRYLFGGQATDAKPFSVAADGTLAYAGNGTSPTVETGPGQRVKVGETGGAVAALYARLDKLKASLTSGDVSSISKDRIAELKDSGDAMVAARGDVGRRLDDVAAAQSTNSRRDAELAARATDIGDIDYATAIVDYTAAQTAYQAALQVASKGFSTGLMDFIR